MPKLKLSTAQQRILEACDGRGVRGMYCKKGILPVWLDSVRTVKVLSRLGLVRPISVPEYAYNGITLTQEGADLLVPPGTVTYPK
jgi:hypothetical protein